MESLLLITQVGDAVFINSEIPYLVEKFNKIHVLRPGVYNSNDKIQDIPSKIYVNYINRKKNKVNKYISLFLILFTSAFYKELRILIKKRELSFMTLRTAIVFLINAIVFQKDIKRILKCDNNISLIYTYWYSHETLSILLLKKHFPNIKFITRTHRYDLYKSKDNSYYQPFKSWMDRNIDKIYFISQHGYDYYLNEFSNSESQKYITSRLGISNKYPFELENINETSDTLFVCSCSNILPVKRVHLIIEALEKIDVIKIHWIHIGDGPEKGTIESIAAELLHNKNNITYNFKGHMNNEQVMQFYSKNYFDCFISTSESEGLPVSMMEAISFGFPIIAPAICGIPEIVNNNTGILLNPDNCVEELKEALFRFSSMTTSEKRTLRKSCREYWEINYRAETQYSRFAEYLNSLIS